MLAIGMEYLDNIDIAKGKYKAVSNIKEAKQQIKRYWNGK